MASEQQLVTRAFITPECRENRTDEGAWDEAVRRLRVEYDAILTGWAGKDEQPTIALQLLYHRPIPDLAAPVIPPLPTEGGGCPECNGTGRRLVQKSGLAGFFPCPNCTPENSGADQ